MTWAGTTILSGLPTRGRRVNPRFTWEDDSLYWNYDEDIYFDLS